MPISVCQNDSQACDHAELAIASAATVQITSKIPLADSISKKFDSGLINLRTGAFAIDGGSSRPASGAEFRTGELMPTIPIYLRALRVVDVCVV